MSTLVKVSFVACLLFGKSCGQGAATCTAFDPVVGTDCVPDSGDFPSQCLNANPPSTTLTVTDKVECTVNFDCCTCDTITCNDCTQSNCNGDSSCIVTDFILNGANSGVSIDCNGDISCAGSSFTATNVKEVKCSGDDACAFTTGDLTCLNTGCSVQCGGDCSCPNANLDINNLSSLRCDGDNACGESILDLNCIITNGNGCPVLCVGDESCIGTDFDIINPDSFICNGEEACSGANVNLIDITGGSISLGGVDGFKGSSLLATSTPEGVDTFECSGTNVCQDSTISIDKCSSTGCIGICSGTNGCKDATIGISSNVNGFNCDGTDSCNGANIIIGNIGQNNQFTLGCNSVGACANSEIDIMIESTSITGLKSVSCGAVDSCDNLVLNIDASVSVSASSSGSNVVIEKFECGGASACDNLTFNFNSVEIDLCVGVPNCNTVPECSNCN